MPRSLAMFVVLASWTTSGCGPSPPAPDVAVPSVTLEPAAPLEQTPPVVRIVVDGFELPPQALALFRGALSDYFVGELKNGKVPPSLRERQVAAVAWRDEPADRTVLAPSTALVADETYTLGVLGARPLATLHVARLEGAAYAARLWPPHEWARGGGRWVFCAAVEIDPGGATVAFDPGGIEASAYPGVDSLAALRDTCVRFEPEFQPGSGVGIPPPRFSTVALDPAPVDFTSEPPESPLGCAAGAVALGGACADVLDDRAVIDTRSAPVLLSMELGGHAEVRALLPGKPLVLRGLPVNDRTTVRGTATDLAGREAAFGVDFVTSAALPHVVVNEVLANPIGPEPAEEWIELTNDGTTDVDLARYTLDHSTGTEELPSFVLAPGKFALLVSRAYESQDGKDVPPAPGTPILRLARLGLSNAGEALVLRAADGTVLSRFPAIVSPEQGVSVARRTPWSLDANPESFVLHAGKGASPGWENDIDTP